ncbi:hypothetical protein B0J14DRAFT_668644 [Halenospora varia]|nr:hypothetical protein B0J14DRAFT_668644 [Halenospora varia]
MAFRLDILALPALALASQKSHEDFENPNIHEQRQELHVDISTIPTFTPTSRGLSAIETPQETTVVTTTTIVVTATPTSVITKSAGGGEQGTKSVSTSASQSISHNPFSSGIISSVVSSSSHPSKLPPITPSSSFSVSILTPTPKSTSTLPASLTTSPTPTPSNGNSSAIVSLKKEAHHKDAEIQHKQNIIIVLAVLIILAFGISACLFSALTRRHYKKEIRALKGKDIEEGPPSISKKPVEATKDPEWNEESSVVRGLSRSKKDGKTSKTLHVVMGDEPNSSRKEPRGEVTGLVRSKSEKRKFWKWGLNVEKPIGHSARRMSPIPEVSEGSSSLRSAPSPRADDRPPHMPSVSPMDSVEIFNQYRNPGYGDGGVAEAQAGARIGDHQLGSGKRE